MEQKIEKLSFTRIYITYRRFRRYKFDKNKFENIEQYNFEEIVTKYNLEDSIIALIFKNEKEVRVLSKVIISDNVILKNQSFDNINISDLN